MTALIMLSCLKHATIMMLLKISGLQKEDLKNYQPVLDLPFIEKVVTILKGSMAALILLDLPAAF